MDCLAAGVTLVVDRYAYSGVAFTAAQLDSPHPRGLDLEWCKVGPVLPVTLALPWQSGRCISILQGFCPQAEMHRHLATQLARQHANGFAAYVADGVGSGGLYFCRCPAVVSKCHWPNRTA